MTLPACLVSLSFRFTGEPLYRQAEAATANLLDVMVDYAVTTSCSRLNVKNSTWLIQIAESLSGEDGAADREKMGKKFHDCPATKTSRPRVSRFALLENLSAPTPPLHEKPRSRSQNRDMWRVGSGMLRHRRSKNISAR